MRLASPAEWTCAKRSAGPAGRGTVWVVAVISRSHFGQLVLAHPDTAYNLAYCLQNRHDAKDAVLDAYVRAFRAFDAFIQAAGVGIFETDINQRRTRFLPELVPPAGRRTESVSDVHHRSIFHAGYL
jgi:hypothetical protein